MWLSAGMIEFLVKEIENNIESLGWEDFWRVLIKFAEVEKLITKSSNFWYDFSVFLSIDIAINSQLC